MTDPRDAVAAGPPAGATAAERLRHLLNYALLAPSSHNTQPWLFRVVGDAVELYADRTRGLVVADPDDRELTVSCGAALFHLRVAITRFGNGAKVEVLPSLKDPDCLARVTLVADGAIDETIPRCMFDAITERRTNRRPFAPRPVPQELLDDLVAAARLEGARLVVVDGPAKLAMADLVARGDRELWANKSFRRELASWSHPNRSASHDGMPGLALGFGDLASYLGPLVVRTFDLGSGRAAQDRELAEHSPAMAVLATVHDEAPSWLAAGQALARVLLRAQCDGVSASYLNQPMQRPALRERVAALLDVDHPQLVLRLGYGPPVPPTPRRPLDDVLLDPGSGLR